MKRAGSDAEREAARKLGIREEWAAEYAEVLFGLGLARVIFNTDRSEDALIDSLLAESVELRTEAGLRSKLAESLNAQASLKQKQKAYEDAEAIYVRALELRRKLPLGDDDGKAKEQSIAQSLVSLGNLWIERGDSIRAPAGLLTEEARERRTLAFGHALEYLQSAKEAYVRGFFPGHPKVAWAADSLGKVHQRLHNLRAAQEAFEEAIAIRQALQDKAEGKQMFTKELEAASSEVSRVATRRAELRGIFQRGHRKMAGVTLMKSASYTSDAPEGDTPTDKPNEGGAAEQA